MKSNPAEGAHPPEFPRPSSTMAKSRLHNRLLAKNGANVSSVQGRAQIDPFAEIDNESVNMRDHPVLASDLWLDGGGSSVFDNRSVTIPPYSLLQTSKFQVPGASTSVATIGQTTNGRHAKSLIGSSSQKLRLHNEGKNTQTSTFISHRNLSRVLENNDINSSFAEFAKILVEGEAEFVYLQIDPTHPYKFSIMDSIPPQMCHSSFMTLSARGIVQYGSMDESDCVTFDRFVLEKKNYDKLLRIRYTPNTVLTQP